MATKIEWTESLIKRFWSYVDKSRDCWIWKAGLFSNGYGQFRVGKKKMKAHRVAYMITNDLSGFPEDKICCHKCDNPKCVNPGHITLADHLFNARDRVSKNRSARNKNPHYGEKNGCAKLKEKDIIQIINFSKQGLTGKEIALRFKVSNSLIYQILRGDIWQQIQR